LDVKTSPGVVRSGKKETVREKLNIVRFHQGKEKIRERTRLFGGEKGELSSRCLGVLKKREVVQKGGVEPLEKKEVASRIAKGKSCPKGRKTHPFDRWEVDRGGNRK